MAATAKKLLSVFLAFVLVFAFTPTVAWGESGDAGGGAAEGGGFQFANPGGVLGGDSEADESAAVLTAQAASEYVGDNFRLKWAPITYEPPEDPDHPITGAEITDIQAGGGANIYVPAYVSDDEDNVYPVLGIDIAQHPSWQYREANSLTIAESVRYLKGLSGGTSIKSLVFEGNSLVTELEPECCRNCYSLETVQLPANLVAVPSKMFESATLTSIVLPNSVRQVNMDAFLGTTNLTSITLNDGLQVIGADAFAHSIDGGWYRGAFPHVTEIAIPSSVYEIQEGAFRKVITLQSVDFGENPQLATIGDRAFLGTGMTSVAIPDSVTSIGSEAFSNNNESVSGSSEWYDVYTITDVQLGSSQEASSLATLGSQAFAKQPITSIVLPDGLTSLGYDVSTYEFDGANRMSGKLGAFSGCSQLTDITWPTVPGLNAVGGFDGCTSLTAETISSLPSWVTRIDDYAFFDCSGLDNVFVPKTVTSIGKGAFSQDNYDQYRGRTYTLLNKDIELDGWTVDDPTTGPWRLEYGSTIRYPQSAAPDSDIVAYRAAVEAYEQARNISEGNRTKFETFHLVSGTVPDGASVRLHANGSVQEPELVNNGFVATEIAEGNMVGVVVSLDGYKDYALSPVEGQAAAELLDDWEFEVTEDMMTPNTQLGILQVRTTGDYARDCNVAVFDHATGRLVSQGNVMRAQVYVVDDIPAGVYDIVAWQKNDYFSRVSSLGDFAALGFGEGDYAIAQNVALAPRETKELELVVPALDVSQASGMLATGEVVIPDLYNPPGAPFKATVRYEVTTGQSVDSVQVNIPEGMEPLAASTAAKDYDVGGWDAASRVLTISGLDEADLTSSRIQLTLKATEPGSYAISASLVSGSATAPVGAAPVECPAVRLVAPQGTVTSRTFTVHVYAAPGSDAELKIGDTVLDAECRTNSVGHAKVDVTIPDDEISMSPYYQVTATLESGDAGEGRPSDSAIVNYFAALDDIPFEPTVRDFWFESANATYYLAKDGKDLSGGSYIFGSHQNNLTLSMPFTAVIDSLQPLGDEATLYLGMLDNSVQTHTMYLSESSDLNSGAKRYVYKGIAPLNDNDDIKASEVPCRFDVMPEFEPLTSLVTPDLSAANMEAMNLVIDRDAKAYSAEGARLFQEYYNSLSDYQKKCLTGEYFFEDEYANANPRVDYLRIAGYDYTFGVFNNSFRHETWDPRGVVWDSLTDEQQANLQEAEDQIAIGFDALAVRLGSKKPMYEYSSFEDYFEGEFGFATGGTGDPAELEAQGYTVMYDEAGIVEWPGDPEYVDVDTSSGEMVWPESRSFEWFALNLDYPSASGEMSAQGEDGMLAAQAADELGDLGDGASSLASQGSWGDKVHRFVIDMAPPQDPGTMDTVIAHSIDLSNIAASEIPQNCAGYATRGTLSLAGMYMSAKSAADGFASHQVIADEKTTRAAELERMEAMNKFYDTYNPGSLCQKALQAEIDYMKDYLKDLDSMDSITYWSNNIGLVAGELGAASGLAAEYLAFKSAAANTNPETAAACKGAAVICGAVSLGCTAVGVLNTGGTMIANELVGSDMAKHAAQVKQWRFYRERECKKDAFGQLHYNKKPIIDPSGFVYAGTEDNFVSGVVATIFELVDGNWVEWDAADYDQENGQVTAENGYFGWDVPQGTWKVEFSKDGYESAIVDGALFTPASTGELVVPPEQTGIGVNLLAAIPPTVTDVAVEGGYVVVTFSQPMKIDTEMDVLVDRHVVSYEWVSPALGTGKAEEVALMSRSLRLAVPAGSQAGDVLHIYLSGGSSYVGKALAPTSRDVELPEGDYPAREDLSNIKRVYGNDRYQTMAAIARESFSSSEYAVIASGEGFADALSASGLAGAYSCPVLLTAKNSLRGETRAVLQELGVKTVFIMGGEAAVSKSAEQAIEGMGISVQRVAGQTRTETSIVALQKVKEKTGSVPTVVIANGFNFPDSLSIAPWSYASAAPIVLTESNGKLTQSEVAAIKALGSVRVVAVGGQLVVSPSVDSQLGVRSTRLAGGNRYETSLAVARWELGNGLTLSAPAVASGKGFADALAGAALCGSRSSVIVLAEDGNFTALEALRGADGCYIFGGELAVSKKVERKIKEILG